MSDYFFPIPVFMPVSSPGESHSAHYSCDCNRSSGRFGMLTLQQVLNNFYKPSPINPWLKLLMKSEPLDDSLDPKVI